MTQKPSHLTCSGSPDPRSSMHTRPLADRHLAGLSACRKGTTARIAGLLTGLMLIFAPRPALADPVELSESEMKAAYLYQFARFVEWPAEVPGSPLNICVIGKSPASFANSLSHLAGRAVRNRRIAVSFISRSDEAHECEMLYVSPSEKVRVESILGSVGSRPILTVSELRHFVAAGGMIGLIPGEKPKFEINQRASQRSGLRISAQLLKLATAVAD